MLDKKFEFELNLDPKIAIENLIEKAGYHKSLVYTDGAGATVVKAKEFANSKDDVFKFIEDISNISGLKFELVDEDLIEEDHEVHFHTEDGKFGGIILFGGETCDGRLPDIEDTRFQLAYDETESIFV